MAKSMQTHIDGIDALDGLCFELSGAPWTEGLSEVEFAEVQRGDKKAHDCSIDAESSGLSKAEIQWLSEHGFLNRDHEFTVEQFKELHCFAVSSKNTDHNSHKSEPDDRNNRPGQFRDGEYRNRCAFAIGVEAGLIEESMQKFADWLNCAEKSGSFNSPEELAAEAFIKLVDIHPFWNGNGRTARLLMNAILVRHHGRAIDTSLIDWHNPNLTGYKECLPADARFLGFLITEAASGRNTHDYPRYLNEDGSKPRLLNGDQLHEATPAELLTCYRDYIGAAPPNLRMTREILRSVELNEDEKKELLNILRATLAKCTHLMTRKDISVLITALTADFRI